MENSNVVNSIEKTLEKKKLLEQQIKQRVDFLNINEKTYIQPKGYGTAHGFYVEKELIMPIAKNQIDEMQAELDGINKKLEAIGALMGAE